MEVRDCKMVEHRNEDTLLTVVVWMIMPPEAHIPEPLADGLFRKDWEAWPCRETFTQEIPRKEQCVCHCSLSLCFLFALRSNFLCPNLLFSRIFKSLLVFLFLVPPFKFCTIFFFLLSLLSFSPKCYNF